MIKWPSFVTLLILFCYTSCKRIKDTNREDALNYRENYYTYLHAESLFEAQNDSSFYYFSKVATNAKDSQLARGAYTYMGMIQHNEGDYFGSQESYLQSQKFLNENDTSLFESIAANYNGLGEDSKRLKNYIESINYFDLAIKFSKDTIEKLIRLNNKASSLKDIKNYDEAIEIYDSILKSSLLPSKEYARTLSNLAYTKWLIDPNYKADTELLTSLQIRLTANDKLGLNASYGHLSDYYSQSHLDSALIYANKMYTNAKNLKSPDDQLWALLKLISLSPPGAFKTYFTTYRQLHDSLQVSRNQAKNQFAVIRYETEKHKADNLTLQKENAETKLRVIWLQLSSIIIGIGAIAGFIFYRKRKQQAMRKQQLRTSQKVHDIVANGLYSIIKRIEYGQELEKNQLLDDMDILYEQSRNISYEHPQTITPQKENQLPSFLKSFATPGTSVSIAGYSTALWKRLQPKTQNEVKLALQNLMINMQKHSQAKNVVIKFDQLNQELKIAYTDDGVGLPKNFRYGNGLSSTENRIRSIGGRIIFDSDPGKGLKIQLFIPTE